MLSNLVEMSGLEPPTPTLSGWCSNRLSYISIWFVLTSLATLVGMLKVVKFTLSGWCSNRLSYIPLFWFYRLSFVFIKFATHDKVPTLEPPVRVGVRVALARFAREVLWCSKTLRATIHRASKQN